MNKRVLTALLLAPLAVAAVLLLPTLVFLPLIAVLMLLGLWEWTRLIGFESHAVRAALLVPHAALMAWLAHYGWPSLFPGVALLGVLFWLMALLWLRFRTFASTHTPAARTLKLLAGSLMVLPAWCALALLHGSDDLGPRWALFAVASVWAADTFAYMSGRRFGGRKLAPSISPGKTWAGLYGGFVGALALPLVVFPLLGVELAQVPLLLGLCVVTMLASVLGDLFESLIKRHAGAKDSGYLIPGHGGVLDRIDSLLAALPVFAVGKDLLGL